MAEHSLNISPPGEHEQAELAAIIGRALNFPPSLMQEFMDSVGPENFRAVRQNGRLAGGMGYFWMGHWFGGRSVPVSGITAVGMAPEYRGKGIARSLLCSALEETHARGVPLSSLYPATVSFYRRTGYERAGSKLVYELPIHLLDLRDRSLELVPAGPEQYEAVQQIYRQYARASAGLLERTDELWARLFRPWPKDKERFTYLAVRDGQPEGYIIYVQPSWGEPLNVVEAFALSRDAARSILTFIADHRSVVRSVKMPGAPVDLLLQHLPEVYNVQIVQSFDWMLRVVDVAGALSQRGYPLGLQGELHLEVHDDLLEHNNRRFVLEVADGQGSVREGGRGDLRLDVRSLAPLYSGHLSAHELLVAGQIGGEQRALQLASSIFAGPRPWIVEIF